MRQQLIETIETETAVKLFTARNMPQASAAQRSDRQDAIQLALRASADVPLEVMRLCAQGLELAATVARMVLARRRPTFNSEWRFCMQASTARVPILRAN
jgi:formiminotetrahydrofolate cyclodeaminase